MFLFRLISFCLRVAGAFVLTLILQIQWDGKSMEHYLVHFGKKTLAGKALNQTGRDGVYVIRKALSSPAGDTSNRSVAGDVDVKTVVREITNKLPLSGHFFEEKKGKK